MDGYRENELPAITGTLQPSGRSTRATAPLVAALATLMLAAGAFGVFELTRQSIRHQIYNITLIGVAAGLIAVFGSVIWFHYSRDAEGRDRRRALSDPAFRVKIAEALAEASRVLDDQHGGPTSNIAALHSILSLSRLSADAAEASVDVAASFIRHYQDYSKNLLEPIVTRPSRAELELAIAILSQLTGQGFASGRVDLSGLSLKGLRLRNLTLRGADLSGADLSDSDISGSDLRGADLTGADLTRVSAVGVHFERAVLTGAKLTTSRLSDSNFSGAFLAGARFDHADLRQARFYGSLLPDSTFRGADLTGADLNGALLVGADLADAVVSDVNVAGAAIDPAAERTLSLVGPSRADLQVVSDSADLRTWTSRLPSRGDSHE